MNGPSSKVRTIAVGSDHGGFELKEALKARLSRQGYRVDDCGVYKKMSVDYPLFAYKVASKVSKGECAVGIVVDGAGIGSCMAANKVRGIRAAMCYDVKTAINSREHNNANVLTLGGVLLDQQTAFEIVDTWLTTECTEPRHLRRAGQIMQIESGTPEIADNTNNKSTPEGTDVSELSEQDLVQIAERITTILQQQQVFLPSVGGCSSCGNSCCGHCAEKSSETVREIITMGASRISYRAGGGRNVPGDLAGFIDHTLLKPDASQEDIENLCADAREFEFASVCINPSYVKLSAKLLKGTPVKICTVVGFPLGAHTPQVKALEARQAIREGAHEIDMVINIGALKSRDLDLLFRDIRSVVNACSDGRTLCKVIIETALLSDEEIIIACETARQARAHFVKTSTGFSTGGATAHHVALMSKVVKSSGMGVKASGGIRSYDDAIEMIKAGATRIGASASVKIVEGGAAGVTESY